MAQKKGSLKYCFNLRAQMHRILFADASTFNGINEKETLLTTPQAIIICGKLQGSPLFH